MSSCLSYRNVFSLSVFKSNWSPACQPDTSMSGHGSAPHMLMSETQRHTESRWGSRRCNEIENKKVECQTENRIIVLDDVYDIDCLLSRRFLISDLDICEHCDCGENISCLEWPLQSRTMTLHSMYTLSVTHADSLTHTHTHLPKVLTSRFWLHLWFHITCLLVHLVWLLLLLFYFQMIFHRSFPESCTPWYWYNPLFFGKIRGCITKIRVCIKLWSR